MQSIIDILNSDDSQYLFQALLHTLWQGAFIMGLLWIVLKSLPVKAAELRYSFSIAALLLIVVCGFMTWAALEYDWQAAEVLNGDASGADVFYSADTNQIAGAVKGVSDTTPLVIVDNATIKTDYYAIGFGVWCLGAIIMLLRAVVKVARANRLCMNCREVTDSALLDVVEQLRKQMRISRKIRVLLTDRINIPAVMGVVYPILLMPASAIGMPVGQVHAMIAHELAHIRRYDYLVNCLQMLFEAILFFNPAVWWVSRQIRIEREACCDDRAVTATGEPINYARALVDWAERLQGGTHTGAAVPMAGFSGNGKDNGLLDRVKRLVVTDHKPSIKMNWLAIGGMLVVSCVVLVALRVGTNEAVGYVGKMLTAEERIEKMQEIAQDYDSSEVGRRGRADAEPAIISGTVRTIDGKPLPNKYHLRGVGVNETSAFATGGPVKDGKFQIKTYGTLVLTAELDGYATKYVGPMTLKPGEVIDGIEIIIDYGFTGRMKIVDDNNAPIRNARFKGHYRGVDGCTVSSDYLDTLESDQNGLIVFENCPDWDMILSITAEGYQEQAHREIRLKDSEDFIWRLKKARSVYGIVVDKKTQKPLSDVQIKPRYRLGENVKFKERIFSDFKWARSDANGQFELNSLSDDCEYILCSELLGYQYGVVRKVRSGEKNIRIEMIPELHISGKILGDIDRIKSTIWNSGYREDGLYTDSGDLDIQVKEGVGYFDLHGFWGDVVKINARGETYNDQIFEKDFTLNDGKSVTDVVIDFRPVALAVSKHEIRLVQLHFETSDKSIIDDGKVQLKYKKYDLLGNIKSLSWQVVPINDSIVSVEMEVPNEIEYKPVAGGGYWFKSKMSGVKIPEGMGVFVEEVVALPAGSIYGEVFDVNKGVPAERVSVSAVMTEDLNYMGKRQKLHINVKNSWGTEGGKYMAAPLPLGGRYRIIAKKGHTVVVSDEIFLSEKESIKEVNLQMVRGEDVRGQIINPEGKAVSGIPYETNCDMPWSGGHSHSGPITDSNGYFEVDGVNFDIPCKYSIRIQSKRDYRPTKVAFKRGDSPLRIKMACGLVVEGVVIDEKTGWPVPGVEVYALVAKGYSRWVDAEEKTNEQGQFRFSNMSDEKYRLGVRGCKIARNKEVLVTAGQAKKVTVIVSLEVKGSTLKAVKPVDQ